MRCGGHLAFIRSYSVLNRRPPSEADIQRFFGVTAPSVHQMVLTLEKRASSLAIPACRVRFKSSCRRTPCQLSTSGRFGEGGSTSGADRYEPPASDRPPGSPSDWGGPGVRLPDPPNRGRALRPSTPCRIRSTRRCHGQRRHFRWMPRAKTNTVLEVVHSFDPPSPSSWRPPYRCPKTTKTGLTAGLLNSDYEEGPLSEKLAGCGGHFSNFPIQLGRCPQAAIMSADCARNAGLSSNWA